MTNTNNAPARMTILTTACPDCGAKACKPCIGERSIQGTLDMGGESIPTVFRDFHPARYRAAKARRPAAFR